MNHFILIRSSILLTLVLTGCVQQPTDLHRDDLNRLQSTMEDQKTQSKRVEDSQNQILSQMEQLKIQLTEQQKLLEAKPQVIEKITRIECPPSTLQKNFKPTKPPSDIDKQIVGLRENILLSGIDLLMPAKVSPQLAHTILDARNIQMFERNSQEWVRFTLYNPKNKEPHVLERKLIEFQNIQGTNKTNERRPIVEMRFTIGNLKQKGQFVLADRSNSEFPVVIGRNLLRDVILVDVSNEYLAPPKRDPEKEKNDKNNSDK